MRDIIVAKRSQLTGKNRNKAPVQWLILGQVTKSGI